jgi:hypothetical protein
VLPLEAIAVIVLLTLLLVYVGMTFISGVRPAEQGAGGGSQQGAPR